MVNINIRFKIVASVTIVLLFCVNSWAFAETNGQYEARVGQVNDRAYALTKRVHAEGYFESVDFDTYIESAAKIGAYAMFLSEGWDIVYQTFAYLRSSDWGNSVTELADAWNSEMKSLDNWADKLTGKRESDGESWKSVYYSKKLLYYFSLAGGASRL